ncbi:MAG: D-Ala-D-Ala carboxypeptidase family metallohydrolase [Sulfurimonas sp.]|uniref:D-Ala-D-Ala carboxypeptidase family metallohydrolase n=1 Tax=Sulfurimonas sp. TaxID=2022749 RepID=UPI002639FFBA|nr:D-Ala-D-Ala carboxypeptidase family metallohydrolase [Sulfurimonas sp.]MDD2651733.1 D-Ala-D-Ala carboxypeptidase family metallohydrolase [Sulfurimonas sp.]MDD2651750.1 D-Ala-D-Ala carboxypeptidase family metallohydrolase [Sulfurimonas sp.]MDD3451698.1 D-Ala-D-Ala carboxypeptidase family metallohydrolase [Sulfurimonas sp.]MDD3451715.1 D-Ala-D-Ala carboxypeptidase family metallohydrolase [Sulfurimonas sp.]
MAYDFGRYFKPKEFECGCGCGGLDISQKLVDRLNTARELLKQPIVINSGFRCLEHNRKIGSEDSSAHVKGLAVDIRAIDSNYRYKLLNVLFFCGFFRIGIDKDFIHIDIDESKPQKVTFLY